VLLAFSAVSRRLERSVVTAAIFFTSAGLLAGPVLGLIDLSVGGEPVKLLAEATLTVRWFASHPREQLPPMESVPAAAHRWRKPQTPTSQSEAEYESRPS
jgi:hypothetical protein